MNSHCCDEVIEAEKSIEILKSSVTLIEQNIDNRLLSIEKSQNYQKELIENNQERNKESQNKTNILLNGINQELAIKINLINKILDSINAKMEKDAKDKEEKKIKEEEEAKTIKKEKEIIVYKNKLEYPKLLFTIIVSSVLSIIVSISLLYITNFIQIKNPIPNQNTSQTIKP
jgi:hypothetical protein